MSLSSHIITSVTAETITSHYPRAVGRNSFRPEHGSGGGHTVVVLRTNRGASGWGLPGRGLSQPAQFIGRSVTDLIDPDSGVIDPAALPLDLALHDLTAKILDLPVFAMLGGRGERTTKCYSGAIYFDDLDPENSPRGLDAIQRNLASDYDLGYRDFKLKLGRGYRWMSHRDGLRRDIEVTQLARELYPDADILVDANDGFTVRTLAEYLEATSGCSLFWIEEPFQERPEDFRALRDLLDACGSAALIADGEYDPRLDMVWRLAADNLLDVALMDVVDFGVTAWRHVMPRLADLNVRASPHAWGIPIKTLYAAQLAAGLGNVITVEGVPGTTSGADTSGYQLSEGRLTIPETPGFGIPLTV